MTQKDAPSSRGPMLLGAPMRGISSWAACGADMAILGIAFFGMVVLPYFSQRDVQFHEFLGMRISIRNLIIANICYWSWYVVFSSFGIYTVQRMRSASELAIKIIAASTACSAVMGLVSMVHGNMPHLARSTFYFWVVTTTGMFATRAVLLGYNRHIKPRLRKQKNLIIVGTGPQAQKSYSEVQTHPEWHYNFLGFVDSDSQLLPEQSSLLLGGMDELKDILMGRVVDEVIIALPMKSQYELVGRAVSICEEAGIQSQYLTDYFGSSVTKRRYFDGTGRSRVVMQVVHVDSRLMIKRIFDIIGATGGIVLLSPVLIGAAIATSMSKGPIIFKQERYGLNKRKFTMYKFRSMVVDAEAKQAQVEHLNETDGPAFKIKNDPRVTRAGAIMRKLSIDELPQLFNVLIGNMSLVGPRPLPIRDVSRFSEAWLMRRFSVKPGLTCLWQVTGRSDTTFDRWVELDLQYIDNWSLGLDAKILFLTVPAVLRGKGAS